MEFKITEQKENPLFQRKEITATAITPISPNKEEIKEILSKHLNSEKDSIRIKKIDGNFGSEEFTITANVYPSKEILERIEHKSKKEIENEKKAEEMKKKAEEEASKPVEEKPIETPEEEIKPEEKSEEVKE